MRLFLILMIMVSIFSLAFTMLEPNPFSIPKGWPRPVYSFKGNELTAEKVFLGRVLFYDPILSKNNTVSCASCHSPYNAFAHSDHNLSHGIYDSIGKRNAPALANLAWQKVFMWDGAIKNLDEQALFPITYPKEMGEDIQHVVLKLQQSTLYPTLFQSAFGDSDISERRILKSISGFLLTLISSNSKYDSVMRHESLFSPQQAHGYSLFRSHCASCHSEPLFTNGSFKNNALPLDSRLQDIGLMGVTGKKSDSLLFKVPSLRNIEYSFPYMHDGRYGRLSEVINHYSSDIQSVGNISPELKKKINLNANDKVDLIAFLMTLSDKHFIFNPEYQFPSILLSVNN